MLIKYKPEDIAILYRTNSQSRAIEDELRRSGIPYQIIGGVKFYDRKEIKDIICYIRILVNPSDSVSFDSRFRSDPIDKANMFINALESFLRYGIIH